MKRMLAGFLAAWLIVCLLPTHAFASLEDHNRSDVVISQSTDENNYYFPDAVKLNDGTILVAYYRSPSHRDDAGAIWAVKSSDDGQTWGTPYVVVDRTAQGVQSRDPNLAILPNGTVVLTYFTNAVENTPAGTYMLMSADGGTTWGSGSGDTGTAITSDILDVSIAKRGSIAVIDNENMLIPVYGVASGDNAYGVSATASGQGQFSAYHRDAVALHYQYADGAWSVVNESLIGREIDETALMYTGEGVVTGSGANTVFDGELYAFAREDGSVFRSADCGGTWTKIATEEPRTWTTSGTIMSAQQIIQPRFTKVNDDCWFVTYANYNQMNYAHDRLCRPVYGKMFYPEAGWYATSSRLIYDEVGHGSLDMADPCSVLTDNGKLLVIYYNTSTKSISGTFTELSEWPAPQEETKWKFWNEPLASQTATETLFTHTSGFSWTDSVLTITGNGSSMTSKETISGNYTAQFDFSFRGASTDGRDEGLYILPLCESTNPGIAANYKYKIRLSTNYGVELLYGTNSNGNYGTEPLTAGYSSSRPASFALDTTYTIKIAKSYDCLNVKVWPSNEDEPLGWHCSWQAETIGSQAKYAPGSYAYPYDFSMYGENDGSGNPYQWKFCVRFVDKQSTKNVFLSNLSFSKQVVMATNYSELTVNAGEKPLNVELNTVFYPNIFAQLPAPETPVEYTVRDGKVSLSPISHPVRIHRANVTGVSAGTDQIYAELPGLVDGNGAAVVCTCDVTVNPANPSAEITGTGTTSVLYAEDFDAMELYANEEDDCSFSAFSGGGFYRYLRFYGMTKQAVVQDPEDAANHYLELYQFSGNANGSLKLISEEPIAGDYTFEADVLFPGTGSGKFYVSMLGQRQPVLEAGTTYILRPSLSSYEKMLYPDYELEMRKWFTRVRNHGVGLSMYDESSAASGWQHVKVVSASGNLYYKSWPRDSQEPAEWEVIMTDARLNSVTQGYSILEFVSGSTSGFNENTRMCLDNIRLTQNTAPGDWYEDISEYRGETFTAPTRAGKLFAGWYQDAEFTKPIEETATSGGAYAKFVDEVVLSVKWQITDGTTAESEMTNLRLLTTVDSLNFAVVGFRSDMFGVENPRDFISKTVYRKIKSSESGEIIMNDPSVFSLESHYFMTFSLTRIPQKYFDMDMVVTPWWKTMDGTQVFGNPRTIRISEDFA